MLYLEAPIGPIKGVMCYRDHADSSLFYYVPERPRLARNDGVPEFIYLKYRRDVTDNADFDPDVKQSLGGGFLAFTVDLGLDDEELKAIKQELGRFADGDVRLAPVDFRKGTVRLTLTKDAADAPEAEADAPRGMSFFEEIYGATKPSLFGFNRATFAVVLPQEAATLFEAALKSGISPIGVIYDLEFLGLRPAFHVKITAEYKRIYDSLEMQFGAKGQIYAVALAAEVDLAFQTLRDSGSVKVEVLNFSDDEALRKQADDAFNWFKTELIKDFFKSSIEPPTFMRQNAAPGMLGQLGSLLGQFSGTQNSTSTPQRAQPAADAPTPAAPAVNQGSNVTSTTQANQAASGGGGTGGNTTGGQASGLSPFQVGFTLKYVHQDELKTREFEYSMQAAVARNANPQGLFSTVVRGLNLSNAIKEVSLDDEFFRRLVATVSMGTDLVAAGISTVAVNLEYPGTRKPGEEPIATDGWEFKPDQMTPRTFTSWLNKKKDLSYRYKMDIHFKPDSPWVGKEAHVSTDWQTVRDRQLTLNPLDEIGLFEISISQGSVDATQVSQVQIEMAYEDSINDFEAHQTFVLRPDQPIATWKLRLSDPGLHTYQYRATYFLKDGVRYQSDWTLSEDPSLVINDPFEGAIKLRLVPLLDVNNLIEADVNVRYHEQGTGYTRTVQTVFAGPTLASQSVAIPTLAKAPEGYSYDVTLVRADGSVFESGDIEAEPDRNTIVVSDGAGTTHRIKVKLVDPNMAARQLAAVRVNLVGPGEAPDSAEVLFTPSQSADQQLLLVQADGGPLFRYTYQVTGYSQIGLPVVGASGEVGDQTLIVPLPTV